jgi:hypothetical protein
MLEYPNRAIKEKTANNNRHPSEQENENNVAEEN